MACPRSPGRRKFRTRGSTSRPNSSIERRTSSAEFWPTLNAMSISLHGRGLKVLDLLDHCVGRAAEHHAANTVGCGGVVRALENQQSRMHHPRHEPDPAAKSEAAVARTSTRSRPLSRRCPRRWQSLGKRCRLVWVPSQPVRLPPCTIPYFRQPRQPGRTRSTRRGAHARRRRLSWGCCLKNTSAGTVAG